MDEKDIYKDEELAELDLTDDMPHSKLIDVNIEKEMKKSFLDYSMSVIVSRALPDVRDGLKPVHRRILYTMYENGLDPSKPYRKCADTVGNVLGKYHPHGDASVYDAMVRLAQDFSLRYPLVDGHGNFGSIDGDPPAAYRYTESRMSKMATKMLTDIDKDTVDFMSNYDDRLKEPVVLPSRFPSLLVNGSMGIAVGMATNIPPHNLRETTDAVCCLIDNPDATLDELMEHIKGPDFPTGGIIMGRAAIRAAYATGRAKITLRSCTEIQEWKNDRYRIIVSEIPYGVNKARLIESIADLVKEKRIEGISDLRDESDREGLRIVIELKREANAQVVLNQLFTYTQLQDTVGVIMLALVNGQPKVLTLKEILQNYIDFQREVITRRTRFDLGKAKERQHILEGYKIAQDNIDEVVHIIRTGRDDNENRPRLMERFGLSEIQANAILAMRLGRLSALDVEKIENELRDITKRIEELEAILGDIHLVDNIIKTEIKEISDKFGDDRRTSIETIGGEMDIEDLIPVEDRVVTLTHFGYIKRTPLAEYKTQNRGGVGMKGTATRDEDFIEHLYVANMHSTMLFFTEQGRCFWLKVYEVPEGSRSSKGRAIQNVLSIPDDKIKAIINVPTLTDEEYINSHFIILATKEGIIKKTSLEAYSRPRAKGVNAVNVREGDELLEAILTDGKSEVLIASRNGRCVRFDETDARPLGRTATGVRGINLDEDDYVIGMVCYEPEAEDAAAHTLLVIGEKGLGKRTDFEEYRKTSRGSKGVRTMNITDKTGKLVALKNVTEENDLLIITQSGLIIRMAVADIKQAGRNTQGVKLINIRDNDSIASVSVVAKSDEEELPAEGETAPEVPAETGKTEE